MIASDPHLAEHRGSELKTLLNAVRSRRGIIVLSVVVATLVTLAVLARKPAQYAAEAVIALDVRKIDIIPIGAVVSPLPQESPVLRTELDVIGSRWMAEKVLERLGPAASRLSGDPTELSEERQREGVVDYLLSRLRVSNDGRSFTIFIAFTADDPATAARIANAFAESYLDEQMAGQLTAIRKASAWLGSKLRDLQNKLEASELAVQSFERGAGTTTDESVTAARGQRFNALNAELSVARANLIKARERREGANGAALSEGNDDRFAAFPRAAVIESLRAQEAQISRTVAVMRGTASGESGEIAALRSKLIFIQKEIGTEIDRGMAELNNDVRVAGARVRELEDGLAAMNAELAEANGATVKLKQLEREASANRSIYESFLNRYKQTLEQESLASPEARLISEAQPPERPINSWLPLLILGVFAGGMVGTVLAIVVDRLDGRVRSIELLEQMTGVAVVGMLPQWKRRIGDQWRKKVGHDLDKNYAESVRRLCVTICLSPVMSDPSVITITSAAPGCGKSSICISLARAMVRMGRKVLLINVDPGSLRRGKRLRSVNDGTFGEAISGERPFDQIVQTDPSSAVHIVTAAMAPDAAHKLLASEGFRTVLIALRKKYDSIIIDAPPLATSVEAALVGRLSDAVLVVVRWRAISYAAVTTALRQLDLCGLSAAGLILNRIDETYRSDGLAVRPQSHLRDRPDLRHEVPTQHTIGIGAVIRSVSGIDETASTRLMEAHRTGTDRS